jgi:hypothetical protein
MPRLYTCSANPASNNGMTFWGITITSWFYVPKFIHMSVELWGSENPLTNGNCWKYESRHLLSRRPFPYIFSRIQTPPLRLQAPSNNFQQKYVARRDGIAQNALVLTSACVWAMPRLYTCSVNPDAGTSSQVINAILKAILYWEWLWI